MHIEGSCRSVFRHQEPSGLPNESGVGTPETAVDTARQAKVTPLLVLALAILTLLAWSSAPARFEWRDIDQNVRIYADGTVKIIDERTFWTNGDFGEAFICIGHPTSVTVTLFDGSSAISPGPPAFAFQQPCDAGT